MADHLIPIEEAQRNFLSCATFLAENISSAEGHAAAMSELVPRFVERSEVDLAAQLADTVNDPFVRDRLLALVAEKCAAMDDDDYAFQLIEAIEDQSSQSMARERVALQKSAKNETDTALEIVEVLSHPDDAFADIALHQIMQNDEAAALNTLERIDFPASRTTAFQNIAVHFTKEQNAEKAKEYFELAVAAAKDIEYYEEKVRALSDVAHRFRETGDNARALELFEDAKIFAERIDGVHRDALLAKLSIGFLQAGDLDSADRTLDLVGDNTQVSSCLVGFSGIFESNGEREEAIDTLEEAYALLKSQRETEIRDSKSRFALFASIAVQFARFEKYERAIEIAQENIDEMQQLSALSQIAQAAAQNENDDFARQALNAIHEDSTKMFTLIAMSDAKKAAGSEDAAKQLLDEAAEILESVPQVASRSDALSAIAVRRIAFGEAESARGLLFENLNTIAEIRDAANRTLNLAKLSEIYEGFDLELNDSEKSVLKEMVRKAEIF